MTEMGDVIASHDDSVELRLVRSEKCSSCPAAGGCPSMDLGLSRDCRLEARNALRARPGDRVEVTIPDRGQLVAGLAVFAIPVALAAAGAVLGNVLAPGNLGTGIGVAAGLGLGIIGAVAIDRFTRRRAKLRPRVTRILHRVAPACHEGR
ncbi:MAG: SoxR reducing system RseC family protein [bacterium]